MLFRVRTLNIGHFHKPITKVFQRWRIHGEQGWYEDWIEVPELENG
jgi:hypothetical protein